MESDIFDRVGDIPAAKPTAEMGLSAEIDRFGALEKTSIIRVVDPI